MRTTALLLVLIFAASVVAAPVPLPNAREAASLVEKLGSTDFTEREAASRRLNELGPLALDALRAACKSDDPEIADRAKDLVRVIERRVTSDRLLAPTLVELTAKDTPLDDVLAALSKQAGCEVVLGGLKPEELATKKISVETGKVPFWSAVLKVCDAAGVQVAVAGGFIAPGAMPYHPKTKPDEAKVRIAAEPNTAVVLEARDGTKKRPASVHGAVLVEAFDTPRGALAPQANTLIQLWPEPRIAWQSVANVKLTQSVNGEGGKLLPDFAPVPVWVPERMSTPAFGKKPDTELVGFKPNLRQAVLKFKPGDGPTPRARELTGTVFGQVRSAVEPLATVALGPKQPGAVTGVSGVELTATERAEKGKQFIDIKLSYDTLAVVPARNTDDLTRYGDARDAVEKNKSVLGVRITDADGKPFDTSLAASTSDFDRTNPRRLVLTLKLELIVAKDGPTVPAKVVFWGSTIKPVEVPFTLKDVPLLGGPR